jgi:antibiotic biosynthesis monooxygenase (ABM) superfamily enzyme
MTMSRIESRRQAVRRPPRYKVALLTWAGAYAVITLILALLGPTMAPWPLPLRTLVLSALMVAALTWLVIPSLTRIFRDWLTPSATRDVVPSSSYPKEPRWRSLPRNRTE